MIQLKMNALMRKQKRIRQKPKQRYRDEHARRKRGEPLQMVAKAKRKMAT